MSKKKNDDKEQTFGILSQYIKDLSFENINSVSQLTQTDSNPEIDVHLKVETEKHSHDKTYIVSLITKIKASLDKPMFVLELKYVGEFLIDGFHKDMLDQILYIECPKILFPFARSVIAHSVGEGGYPPLYLSPVNFADLYEQQNGSKDHALQ